MDVKINHAEMQAFLEGPASPIMRDVEKYTRRTETAAKRKAPVDDGTLRASVQSTLDATGGRIVGTVYSPLKYAIYQELGTGVYAGNGPIKPKSGKYLVFQVKQRHPQKAGRKGGKGNLVFAREVKGTPPTHFLENALRDTVPWPVRTLGA